MFLDDCPKLRRRDLQAVGALGAGVKTYWTWPGLVDAPTIEVTGGVGAFTIASEGGGRVVMTKRRMICPRCGAECYMLVFYVGWGCRICSRRPYRLWWHKYRSPMEKRRMILRQLARADPLSLRTVELERKLRRVNRAIAKRARYVGERISSGRRG